LSAELTKNALLQTVIFGDFPTGVSSESVFCLQRL